MTAALKNELSAKAARRLTESIKQNWQNFERGLAEAIELQVWVPLGYGSWIEYWTAEFSEFTLFPEMRAHVVYAYFDQGGTVDEVAAGVKGIGRDRAESLKRQKDNGVPAHLASLGTRGKWHNVESDTTIVREHPRKKPSEASTLHVTVGVAKLKRINAAAKKLGLTAEEFATSAIDEKLKAG